MTLVGGNIDTCCCSVGHEVGDGGCLRREGEVPNLERVGLGFAGTAEGHVAGGDVLKGYRGALYLGIGLSGLGLAVAIFYALLCKRRVS